MMGKSVGRLVGWMYPIFGGPVPLNGIFDDAKKQHMKKHLGRVVTEKVQQSCSSKFLWGTFMSEKNPFEVSSVFSFKFPPQLG